MNDRERELARLTQNTKSLRESQRKALAEGDAFCAETLGKYIDLNLSDMLTVQEQGD